MPAVWQTEKTNRKNIGIMEKRNFIQVILAVLFCFLTVTCEKDPVAQEGTYVYVNGQLVHQPTVTTNEISDVTPSTASCGGNVTNDGGSKVIARGVCWSKSQNPIVGDSCTKDGGDTGDFTSSITGLSANTTYYVRAYATNAAGTAYGALQSFKTTVGDLPAVTTATASNVTDTSATCGGDVTAAGSTSVIARGVCWSSSPSPTISNSHTSDGEGTGSFTSSITGLALNTTYYVRAYATNAAGTSYGEQQTFRTTLGAKPTVSTNFVSDITIYTATCGGDVTNSGSTPVTARGVCWSYSQNPTVGNYHTTDGSGTGNYTSSITGLSANTTYYVRAYATNAAGTAYGALQSFKTTVGDLPAVTTATASNVTDTSATCGGDVTAAGSTSVIARGVCWSSSPSPTLSNSHTANGYGLGSFTSNMTGLFPNTTYYVRAYATSSSGTSYGNQKSFTTTAPCGGTINDVDGNTYNIVQIGNQCWMAQNLRTTHYADGTAISAGGDNTSTTTGYYYFTSRLYNWKAVMRNSNSSNANPSGVQGICPTGWHVPSDAEWTHLENYVGSQSQYLCNGNSSYIAKALAATSGWYNSIEICDVGNNQSSNNATGFSAIPAGACYGLSFSDGGMSANFWSSTSSSSEAYDRSIDADFPNVYRSTVTKEVGLSVRCLHD